MKESYLSVQGVAENTIVIERSKFICTLREVADEEAAKQFIAGMRKTHSLATHNCYAYIADEIGNVMKYSDDGEPQGTAGMPMLEVLKNRKIMKTAAVVTRYFGGIKLGAGGLVRAYAESVSKALDGARIVENHLVKTGLLKLTYDQYPKMLQFLEREQAVVERTDFTDEVSLALSVPCGEYGALTARLTDYFAGKVSLAEGETHYAAFAEGAWRS